LLFEEPFVAYVSADHPLFHSDRVRANSLRLEAMWLLTQGHCLRDHDLSLCTMHEADDEPVPLRFESGNLETLRRLVESGEGLTLLPELAVAGLSQDERARIRQFESPAPTRTVRLIQGRALLKRRAIDVLRKALAV